MREEASESREKEKERLPTPHGSRGLDEEWPLVATSSTSIAPESRITPQIENFSGELMCLPDMQMSEMAFSHHELSEEEVKWYMEWGYPTE